MKLLILFSILFTAENSFSQIINRSNIKVTILEYNNENQQIDTSTSYVESKANVTFDLINEHLNQTIKIPDSFKNNTRSADTIITKIHVGIKDSERIVSIIYDHEGFLSEYYYSSCAACGNQPTRSYYFYNKNKIETVVLDNLGNNTRQIYELNYDPENAISQIKIYKEYHTKNLNPFSNIFGRPILSDDLDYLKKTLEKRVLIRYD